MAAPNLYHPKRYTLGDEDDDVLGRLLWWERQNVHTRPRYCRPADYQHGSYIAFYSPRRAVHEDQDDATPDLEELLRDKNIRLSDLSIAESAEKEPLDGD
jgi:hypothetical protein